MTRSKNPGNMIPGLRLRCLCITRGVPRQPLSVASCSGAMLAGFRRPAMDYLNNLKRLAHEKGPGAIPGVLFFLWLALPRSPGGAFLFFRGKFPVNVHRVNVQFFRADTVGLQPWYHALFSDF